MLHLSRGGRRLLAFCNDHARGDRTHRGAERRKLGDRKPAEAPIGGPVAEQASRSSRGAPLGPHPMSLLWTLTNGRGMTVTITNYGATVQSIWVPDRWGKARNVALGFPKLSDYVNDFTQGATNTPWPLPGGSGDVFFGATIGRYANRIAGAKFTMTCDPAVRRTTARRSSPGREQRRRTRCTAGSSVGTPSCGRGSASTSGHDVSLRLTHSFPAGEGCTTSTCTTGYPAPVTADGHVARHRGQRAEDRLTTWSSTAPRGGGRHRHQPHQPHVFQPGR